MAHIKSALIVGGGIGGMSTAIQLRKRGIEVQLVDIDTEWKAQGAGITITGPTLRAFKQLGVIEAVGRLGYFSSSVGIFAADGKLVAELPRPPLEPDLPSAGGILRPVLHEILSTRVRESGTTVRLGVSVKNVSEDADHVLVNFSDGGSGTFELVVGADGVQSALRTLLFATSPKPSFTGQGCWRMLADRPAEVSRGEIYLGATAKVGVNPCSPTKMYVFATLQMPGNPRIDSDEFAPRLKEILRPFGGTIAKVRETINEDSLVNYRPLETLLLEPPWHVGRVGLIGDAVHATTPHLASGAGMTVEDSIVLDDEMARAVSVSVGWESFTRRRFARCAAVVRNSVRIGELEMANESPDEQTRLLGATMQLLAQPI